MDVPALISRLGKAIKDSKKHSRACQLSGWFGCEVSAIARSAPHAAPSPRAAPAAAQERGAAQSLRSAPRSSLAK